MTIAIKRYLNVFRRHTHRLELNRRACIVGCFSFFYILQYQVYTIILPPGTGYLVFVNREASASKIFQLSVLQDFGTLAPAARITPCSIRYYIGQPLACRIAVPSHGTADRDFFRRGRTGHRTGITGNF